MPVILFLAFLALSIFAIIMWQRARQAKRANFIRTYRFHPGLFRNFEFKYPDIDLKEQQLVARGLRHFFLSYLQSGLRPIAMPSHIADALWHEFILSTREYERFCQLAFGKTLHHIPAYALSQNRDNNDALKRVWTICCREENINPNAATRLPLLFALDAKLNIEHGFHYQLDCSSQRKLGARDTHCASDFSHTNHSSDSNDSGYSFSDNSSSNKSSDGSDSSSGDSGDSSGGCGGGCGGGD
jgi:hypothetical protein